MSAYIDLHCHVLPGLDDGPPDLDAAVALVLALEGLGFGEIHPTPHQKEGSWAPSAEQRGQAAEQLRRALQQRGAQVVIGDPGGENMWDSLFVQRHSAGDYPTYAGGKAFLVEFSPDQGLPPGLTEQLFRDRLEGRLPVVAHVERYPQLLSQPQRLAELGQRAALLVNLSSLASWIWGRATRRLVRAGLVHAVASDGHNLVDTEAGRKGMNWLRSAMGEEAAALLLRDNPRRILSGELPFSLRDE